MIGDIYCNVRSAGECRLHFYILYWEEWWIYVYGCFSGFYSRITRSCWLCTELISLMLHSAWACCSICVIHHTKKWWPLDKASISQWSIFERFYEVEMPQIRWFRCLFCFCIANTVLWYKIGLPNFRQPRLLLSGHSKKKEYFAKCLSSKINQQGWRLSTIISVSKQLANCCILSTERNSEMIYICNKVNHCDPVFIIWCRRDLFQESVLITECWFHN